MNYFIFLVLSNYFIFLGIFEELLDAAMWLKLPKGLSAGCLKNICCTHKILDF
jgi:hypothetical protein